MDKWENHFDLFEKNNSSSWQAAAASLLAQQGRSERAARPEQIKSISIKSAELQRNRVSVGEGGGGSSEIQTKWQMTKAGQRFSSYRQAGTKIDQVLSEKSIEFKSVQWGPSWNEMNLLLGYQDGIGQSRAWCCILLACQINVRFIVHRVRMGDERLDWA